jgi:hypothetical protein
VLLHPLSTLPWLRNLLELPKLRTSEENAIKDKILKEIDGEVKKRKRAKASERGSTY